MTSSKRQSIQIACVGLLALAVTVGIGRFVFTPILPFMVQALDLTKAQAGLIASSSLLGYLFGAIIASRTTLPGGLRGWFIGGVVLTAVATTCQGLVTSVISLLVVRFVSGIGGSIVLVFGSALILGALEKRGWSNLAGVYFSGPGVGIVVSSVVVSWAASVGFDWRWLWIFSGMLSLSGAAVVYLLAPASSVSPGGTAPSEKPPNEPGLIAFISAYGLAGFGYIITATFLSTMVHLTPNLRPLEPYIWLIFGLAAIPSVGMWTWIGGRYGNDSAFAAACLLEAIGVILSVIGTSEVALIVAALLVGGTFNGFGAVGMLGVRDLTRGNPRRNFGIMSGWFGLGQIVGPIFAGFISDLTDSFVIPSLIAALTLLTSTGLAMLSRYLKKRPPSPGGTMPEGSCGP